MNIYVDSDALRIRLKKEGFDYSNFKSHADIVEDWVAKVATKGISVVVSEVNGLYIVRESDAPVKNEALKKRKKKIEEQDPLDPEETKDTGEMLGDL